MRPSPIQLLHVVYRRVAVNEYAAGDRNGESTAIGFDFQGVNIKAKVGCGLKRGQDKNPRDFLVELEVLIDNREGKPTPYNVEVGIIGIFKVLPPLPPERREDLVAVNGASILYGTIREIVLGLTSRFAAGPMTLPGMNFEDHAPSSAGDSLVDIGHETLGARKAAKVPRAGRSSRRRRR